MFDVGIWELTLLAVIALIVLGPERLPVVARTAGRWVGRARTYARGLTDELQREVDVDGLREEVNRARDSVESGARYAKDEVEAQTRDVVDDTRDVVDSVEDSVADLDADATPADTTRAAAAAPQDDSDATTVEDARTADDDLAEYGDAEPFSIERARAQHAERDRESQL